jgi:hypothetical protein
MENGPVFLWGTLPLSVERISQIFICDISLCYDIIIYKLCIRHNTTTVEPGYNDIGLYETSPITSDILWYQLIRHC